MASRKASQQDCSAPAAQQVIDQVQVIARGLASTFAPFCEVVVHDLRNPKTAIIAIENNLSGRDVGDPITDLGLARLADDDYPDVVANYANVLRDGRRVKSTSIGIKDDDGHYVAALCLNIDLTLFNNLRTMLEQFGEVGSEAVRREELDPTNVDAIRRRIDEFAASRATTPAALRAPMRREVVRQLVESGLMDLRRSADIAASHLSVSRATIYLDAKVVREAALAKQGDLAADRS